MADSFPFIVFEGLDGAGTTTQSKLLASYLGQQGVPWRIDAEPSDKALGKTIRTVLRGQLKMPSAALALLFAADRVDHCFGDQGIFATTNGGSWIISDRYVWSSLAYQGMDHSTTWLAAVNEKALAPHITFFLDVDVETCLARQAQRELIEIFENDDTLRRVAEGYHSSLEFYEKHWGPVEIIDGTQEPEKILGQVVQSLEAKGLIEPSH